MCVAGSTTRLTTQKIPKKPPTPNTPKLIYRLWSIHGEPTQAVATLVFDSDIPQSAVSVNAVSTSYELLSDEDLEEIFNI